MTNVAHHIRSRFDCLLDPLNADLIDLLITFYSVYDITSFSPCLRHGPANFVCRTYLRHSTSACWGLRPQTPAFPAKYKHSISIAGSQRTVAGSQRTVAGSQRTVAGSQRTVEIGRAHV